MRENFYIQEKKGRGQPRTEETGFEVERHLGKDLYIDREEFEVRQTGPNAMLDSTWVVSDLTAHKVDVHGRKLFLKGLLDTGVVVIVMPVSTWSDMDFDRSDLISTNIRLAAANQGAIYVTGRNHIISLRLDE